MDNETRGAIRRLAKTRDGELLFKYLYDYTARNQIDLNNPNPDKALIGSALFSLYTHLNKTATEEIKQEKPKDDYDNRFAR